MSSTALGAFLKARRDCVLPGEVGLTTHGVRRVAGLRREEVAMLAGVSVDYYTRLEQGRERNPSPSVLNALSGALNLDPDAREHIFRLAGLAPTPSTAADKIDDSLLELLASWPQTPALIINRQLDILAHNEIAGALFSNFAHIDNLVYMTFIDPVGREFFTDWVRASETCVANLRLALGHPATHEQVRAVINRSHAESADFRRLWSQHNVRGKTHEAKQFHHRDIGDLVLHYAAFDVRSSPGHQLIVYRAVDGTPDADKLQLLGSLAATAKRTIRHL